MRNRTKEKLRRGEAVLGTFVFLGDPSIVEIAAISGLDFVVIDTEHAGRDIAQVEGLVRAADAADITPLVRVSRLDDKEILRALETGAQGIMVPQVESADEVRQMLSAMRYPPHGTRSTCRATRAAGYGSQAARFAAHAANVDDELLSVVLVETAQAIEHLAEILEAGPDVAFLGKADLASSMGFVGDVDAPAVEAAVQRFLEECRSRSSGPWPGLVPYGGAETFGCPFVMQSSDANVLLDGFSAFVARYRSPAGSSAPTG